MLIHKNAGN